MPTFAAIDIGSNSCRLAIATVQQHKLKTLHEDREVTRLGESVFEAGVISPEALANTINDGLTGLVVGRRPMSDYDQIVKDWLTNGGEQMRKEFMDALASAT